MLNFLLCILAATVQASNPSRLFERQAASSTVCTVGDSGGCPFGLIPCRDICIDSLASCCGSSNDALFCSPGLTCVAFATPGEGVTNTRNRCCPEDETDCDVDDSTAPVRGVATGSCSDQEASSTTTSTRSSTSTASSRTSPTTGGTTSKPDATTPTNGNAAGGGAAPGNAAAPGGKARVVVGLALVLGVFVAS